MIYIYIAFAVDGCCLPWVNMHEILNLVKLLSHRSLCYEMNHAPSKALTLEVTPTVGFQVEEFSKNGINFTVYDMSGQGIDIVVYGSIITQM